MGGMQDLVTGVKSVAGGSMRPAGRIPKGPEGPLHLFSSLSFFSLPPFLLMFLPPLSGAELTACPVSTPTAGLETPQRQIDVSGQPASKEMVTVLHSPEDSRTCLDSTFENNRKSQY